MQPKRDYHLRLQDEAKLKALAVKDPRSVLSTQRAQFIPEHLAKIGIDYQAPLLGKGFIKLRWSDFIVEEISLSGDIINIGITPENHPEEKNEVKPKTEADLVKQGMSTIEAIERLAENLHVNSSQVTYAGMKDASAITAQQISFNGMTPDKAQELKIPNLFLKNIHERKGVVEIGKLFGNRFTILVRTPENQVDLRQIQDKVNELNHDGFYNFYSLQRFGSRLLSHKIGGRILRGEYEEAAKMFLVGENPHEMNFLHDLREAAQEQWQNWAEMEKYFQQFPYFCYYELLFLENLRINNDFTLAFKAISEQTKIFVYAYFSYWFNKLLSRKIYTGKVPSALPLLRNIPDSLVYYENLVPREQFEKIQYFHRDLEFLNLNRAQAVSTKIIPKIWSVTPIKQGYVFHFDLEKGAYATTMLSQMFELYQGKPLPDWINQETVDARQTIGYQLVQETIDRFPKGEDDVLDLSE